MTPGQLRGPRLRTPFYGVREAVDAPLTLITRCRALARALPDEAAFAALTVARLGGWWLPRGAETLPLDVLVPPNLVIDRPGVRCIRSAVREGDVVDFKGLRITTGARTFRDLARSWSLVDLVVMLDCALRKNAVTLRALAEAAEMPGGRGVRTLRRAISRADARSESPMETLMRLLIVISGLPAPVPQRILRDSWGNFLARGDLVTPDGRSVFEFDGASHDLPERRADDAARWRLLREYGFEVYPYTARDLFGHPENIICDYQRAVGLTEDPRAVEAWLREFLRSSFGRSRIGRSSSGRSRIE
jgi:hypothetical protein